MMGATAEHTEQLIGLLRGEGLDGWASYVENMYRDLFDAKKEIAAIRADKAVLELQVNDQYEDRLSKVRRQRDAWREKAMSDYGSILDKPIDELWLSTRVRNCLDDYGRDIRTVRDLAEMTKPQLMCLENFGRVCLENVENALKAHGLTLGMRF
jgi:DNA-directed RNA polymerase alpha subunit